MKKRTFFLPIIVIIALISLFLFSRKEKVPVSLDLSSSDLEYLNTKTDLLFFVLQTGFKNPIYDVSVSDLKQETVNVFSEDESIIKQILGENVKTDIISDIGFYSSSSSDDLFFIPFNKADYRLKTVRIDGVYLWDLNNNYTNYPLYGYVEKGKGIDKDELEEKLFYSMLFTGEMIPARDVAKYRTSVDSYDYFFEGTKSALDNSDTVFGFLENSVFGHPTPCGGGCVVFLGDEEFLLSMQTMGIDGISLGANHIGDGGIYALSRTLELLDQYNISHTGASDETRELAVQPFIKEINGKTIVFLAYDDVAYYYWATDASWGSASLSVRGEDGIKYINYDKLQSDIEYAKSLGDMLVVMMSWGESEYVNYALPYQKELGHAIIDAGADLIIGTHQHWASEIEYYNNSIIFYGLGNYIFDQTHTDETREGVFIKTYFYNNNLVNYDIIPHMTCGYHQLWAGEQDCKLYQPQLLTKNNPVFDIIINRMMENSDIK